MAELMDSLLAARMALQEAVMRALAEAELPPARWGRDGWQVAPGAGRGVIVNWWHADHEPAIPADLAPTVAALAGAFRVKPGMVEEGYDSPPEWGTRAILRVYPREEGPL